MRLTSAVLSILIVLLLVSCKERPTEPKPIDYNLQLSVRFQGCKTIKFNLSCADSTREKIWVLNRDGQFISSDTLYGSDTVITDNSVSVDNTYKYQALFYNKSDNFLDSSMTLEVVMLPSTSHEFAWMLDTLGYWGYLHDVFAISENDVWVVGEFMIDKPDTIHNSEYTDCNAAHWNGTMWEPMYIPVYNYGTYWYFQLYSVFGFSSDEVYFLGHNRLVMWNGNEFVQKLNLLDVPGITVLEQLWGYSGEELYIGGSEGFMLKTDGENWERIPSFTTREIREIVGDSHNKLWITANNSSGHGYYHYFDGNVWQSWGTQFYPGTETIIVDAICSIDDSYIITYVGTTVGTAVAHSQDDYNDYEVLYVRNTGWWLALDGNDINDFFGVGDRNTVTHFNGKTTKDYLELSGYSFWEGVDQIGDYVFIVGNPAGPVVAIGKR